MLHRLLRSHCYGERLDEVTRGSPSTVEAPFRVPFCEMASLEGCPNCSGEVCRNMTAQSGRADLHIGRALGSGPRRRLLVRIGVGEKRIDQYCEGRVVLEQEPVASAGVEP